MDQSTFPTAVTAAETPVRSVPSRYPEPFAKRINPGRVKHPLGDLFGLTNFGVNLTRLAPGGESALRHSHTRQDEFVYILSGQVVLRHNRGETVLEPGMCAGFKANSGDAHQLVNRGTEEAVYLEVGDRCQGDVVTYPDDDLAARFDDLGKLRFTRKDGSDY